MEFIPLILIVAPLPGAPEPCVTKTPAARPAKARSKEIEANLLKSSAFTVDTDPVKSLFLTVP